MLFSLIKHYYTALKVFWCLYCFTTSICHGVENYFPRLWGTGISDAIWIGVTYSELPMSHDITNINTYKMRSHVKTSVTLNSP